MQECIKISCQRHIHFLEYGRTLAKTVTVAAASERPTERAGDDGERKAVAAHREKKIDQKVDRYSDKDKAACGGEPAEDIRERFDPGTD